jgi:hypothetical protein
MAPTQDVKADKRDSPTTASPQQPKTPAKTPIQKKKEPTKAEKAILRTKVRGAYEYCVLNGDKNCKMNIARRFGISLRTVYRYLGEPRQRPPDWKETRGRKKKVVLEALAAQKAQENANSQKIDSQTNGGLPPQPPVLENI